VQFNRSAVIEEFEVFCKKEKYESEHGLKILNESI
jgi:hypothetical protein